PAFPRAGDLPIYPRRRGKGRDGGRPFLGTSEMLQGDKPFRVSWPGNTTPQAVDGAGNVARTLAGFTIANSAAAARFVRLYDQTSSATVGSDAPKRVVQIGAGTTLSVDFARGKQFINGLWMSVTTLAADSDTTAPAAGDVLATVDFV